jgi:CheY-like chemotaxis protein
MENQREIEILLVEDNPIDREITLGVLKKHQFANKIYVVEDGEEALKYIFDIGNMQGNGDHKLRMVLLDLRLPKVDGLEVLQKIKSDSQTKNIPVVILTSSAEEFDIVKGYNLGVNNYILKPVNFIKMINAIKEVWPAESTLCELQHENR